MRLLLLNNNPAVSRLITLSVNKVGYTLDEFEEYGLVPLKPYDIIMVDNECYDEEELRSVCDNSQCHYVVYICQRGSQKPEFANVALEKPFLPTDFLTLLEKIKAVLMSQQSEEESLSFEEMSDGVQEDTALPVDLEAIDSLELEPLDGSDADVLLEEEEDVAAVPLSVLDLDSKEDELLDLTLPHSTSEDDAPALALHEEMELPQALEEEEVGLALEMPSVLDKDDIDEVKQLLDESEEWEEEPLVFDKTSLEEDEALILHEDDEDALVLKDMPELDEEEKEEDTLFASLPDEDDLVFAQSLESEEDEPLLAQESLEDEGLLEDEQPQTMETLALDEIEEEKVYPENEEDLQSTQEAFIDAFEEEMPDVAAPIASEESFGMPTIDTLHVNDFSSLDDLNEVAIKRAFGEEVDEITTLSPHTSTEMHPDMSQDVEVIRGEIENTIARSIDSLAHSDVLREALRGMRINISITFDEK